LGKCCSVQPKGNRLAEVYQFLIKEYHFNSPSFYGLQVGKVEKFKITVVYIHYPIIIYEEKTCVLPRKKMLVSK
jgi:hypothetical protein